MTTRPAEQTTKALRRKVQRIHRRLLKAYGAPRLAAQRNDGVSELVSCILSQHTFVSCHERQTRILGMQYLDHQDLRGSSSFTPTETREVSETSRVCPKCVSPIIIVREVVDLAVEIDDNGVGFLKEPSKTAIVPAQPISEYDLWRQRALAAIREYQEQGPGADLVARTVLKIVESKTPGLRYLIGQQAQLVSRLRRFLPEAALERGTRSIFRLDTKK